MQNCFETTSFQFLKGKKRSHPPFIHCAPFLGASKLKNLIFGIFSKDDSSGNAGVEGG
ncbi:hypothetical protein LEP1GSC089_1615 [Leptospira interrogans serovar Autumnalis str. LP101]|nr:hypothetical protein LEP1GSC089_1615 [Leptospira interrogans serovar Autumnalis str. LP101]EMN82269.1 hypothetical protein LEP1GSC106_3702 [Leptospira interrogans serovar Grippotyphosa str. UI 12764]